MAKAKKIKLPRSVKRLFPHVKHAIDATKYVEVSVSKKDCDSAKKLNPSECALARATKREQHATAVIIGMTSSYIIRGNTATRYQTPASVQREIVSFDRHQDFAPGEYYLRPKAPQNKLHQHRTNREGGKDKTVKRVYHHSARVRILARGVE